MATVSAVILKHHKKQDGTWNVKIRITNNGSSAYLDTSLFATRNDVTTVRSGSGTKIRLKKVFIDNYLTTSIVDYRKKLNDLGSKVDYMSASEVKKLLMKDDEAIDLFEFADRYIESMEQSGRKSSSIKRKSNFKKFREFTKRTTFPPDMLTSKLLKEFEAYLRKDKLSSLTVRNIMSDLQAIFNQAKEDYNDEEIGLIKIHNSPFSRYKIPEGVASRKKALSIEQIKMIRDVELENEVDRLSRDLFMLSFYMCGTNANDFHSSLTVKGIERFEYNRNKTKGKRADEALISIKVVDEAKPLVEKLAGQLQERFNTPRGLNNRLWKSLSENISDATGIAGLTYYHARHTFATLARRCGYSRDDVGAALNHKRKLITDDYIDEDWSLIDKIQRSVLDLLK